MSWVQNLAVKLVYYSAAMMASSMAVWKAKHLVVRTVCSRVAWKVVDLEKNWVENLEGH